MECNNTMQTNSELSTGETNQVDELHIQIDEDDSVSDTSVTQLTSSDCNSFLNTQTRQYNTLTSLTSSDTSQTSETDSEIQIAQEKILQSSSSASVDSSKSSGCSQLEENIGKNSNSSKRLPKLDSEDWYLHPSFRFYWQHYNHAMSWCQKHHSVVKHLRQKHASKNRNHNFPYNYPIPAYNTGHNLYMDTGHGHRLYSGNDNLHMGCNYGNIGRGRGRGRKNDVQTNGFISSNGETDESFSSLCDSTEDSGTSYSESEKFEMEITDEMLQFFAKSHKHRKEREEKKLGADGKEEEHVDIDSMKVNKKAPTSEAPKERPGSRRTAEMITLYGKGAAMIHGMETALQMTFDRNMDVKQPKVWPNMPLKLVFN